jgi:hypothetical protein
LPEPQTGFPPLQYPATECNVAKTTFTGMGLNSFVKYDYKILQHLQSVYTFYGVKTD